MERNRGLILISIGCSLLFAAFAGLSIYYGMPEFMWIGSAIGGLPILMEPSLGMYLVAATIPLEAMNVFPGGVTFSRILGLAVSGLWLVNRLAQRKSFKHLITTPLFYISALLLTMALMSTYWAAYPEDIYDPLFRLFRLLIWSLLVFDMASTRGRVAKVSKVLVIAGAVAAILTIFQFITGNVTSTGRAGMNISGNLNNTAAVLVTIIPFTFYLIQGRESQPWRFVGLFALALSISAVALSFSRTAYILIIFVLVAEFWGMVQLTSARRWLFLIAFVLAVTVFLLPLERVIERAQLIRPALEYSLYGEYSGDPSYTIVARGFIYRVGLAIFRDHPFIGVGFNNFSRYFLAYQYEFPGEYKLVNYLINPHSAFLGFLVDLGIIGIVLWITLLGVNFKGLVSILSSWSAYTSTWELQLIRAVSLAMIVQVINGFVSTVQYEKLFWLLLGLVAAIQHFTRPGTHTGGLKRA